MSAFTSEPVRPVCFTLLADAEPGLLPRLLQPFARRDLTPDRLSASRLGDALRVEIAMLAMPTEMVSLVEGNLRQVVGVHSVAQEALALAA
jgi:acetolactate synthase small subunit